MRARKGKGLPPRAARGSWARADSVTFRFAFRMIQMYGAFAPVVLHYRLLEAKQDRLGIKPASKVRYAADASLQCTKLSFEYIRT